MSDQAFEIPANRVDEFAEALALVLRNIPGERREAIVAQASPAEQRGVFVVRERSQLCGAAWVQAQPGNTAIFWPPQLVVGAASQVALVLMKAATAHIQECGFSVTLSLVRGRQVPPAGLLEKHGFKFLADLTCLSSKLCDMRSAPPRPHGLTLEVFAPDKMDRLAEVIERTYEDTLDCPALNGVRNVADVIEGYRAIGQFDPCNWFFVRHDGQDVGVLILAVHPEICQCELLYMGVVPKGRGRGWGSAVARQAQWLAKLAGAERLTLAVDAANSPAVRIYTDAGFQVWERCTVFVRVAQQNGSSNRQTAAA